MVLFDVNSDNDVLELFIDAINVGVLRNPAPDEHPKLKVSERFKGAIPAGFLDNLMGFYLSEHIESLYAGRQELPEYTLTRGILQEFLYRDDLCQYLESAAKNKECFDFLCGRSMWSRSRVIDMGLTALVIDYHLQEGSLIYQLPDKIKIEQ